MADEQEPSGKGPDETPQEQKQEAADPGLIEGLISRIRKMFSRSEQTEQPDDGLKDPSQAAAEERKVRSREAQDIVARMTFAKSEEDAETLFRAAEWRDPFPGIPPALLNSADIADYVAQAGMIHPFEPGGLKSASYAVPLLGEALYWDDDGKQVVQNVRRGDTFTLRQNSIAFVTLEPTFRFPYYIAARFNLKIPNVYRGLLLGTGPLVDPGWTGKLSIPLHNLTTNDYKFDGGEELIWMEFTKLSPNDKWLDGTWKEPGREGIFVPFPPDRRGGDVETRLALASPNRPVSSSLASALNEAHAAVERAKDTEERATRLSRLITVGGGLALVVALATIMALAIQVWSLRKDVRDLKNPATTTTQVVAPSPAARAAQARLRRQVAALQKKVASLEARVPGP